MSGADGATGGGGGSCGAAPEGGHRESGARRLDPGHAGVTPAGRNPRGGFAVVRELVRRSPLLTQRATWEARPWRERVVATGGGGGSFGAAPERGASRVRGSKTRPRPRRREDSRLRRAGSPSYNEDQSPRDIFNRLVRNGLPKRHKIGVSGVVATGGGGGSCGAAPEGGHRESGGWKTRPRPRSREDSRLRPAGSPSYNEDQSPRDIFNRPLRGGLPGVPIGNSGTFRLRERRVPLAVPGRTGTRTHTHSQWRTTPKVPPAWITTLRAVPKPSTGQIRGDPCRGSRASNRVLERLLWCDRLEHGRNLPA